MFKEASSVAGAEQGAMGEVEERAKAGVCLMWMGVPRTWTGDLTSGLPSATTYRPLLPPPPLPEAAMLMCPVQNHTMGI